MVSLSRSIPNKKKYYSAFQSCSILILWVPVPFSLLVWLICNTGSFIFSPCIFISRLPCIQFWLIQPVKAIKRLHTCLCCSGHNLRSFYRMHYSLSLSRELINSDFDSWPLHGFRWFVYLFVCLGLGGKFCGVKISNSSPCTC